MGNPLFNQLQGGAPVQPQMPQMNNFMQRLQQFGSMLNGNPQQIVQSLIQSGRMSQEQFQQYSQMANQILGRSS